MPLLSPEFALFFLAFFPIYWLLQRWPAAQNGLLLLVSIGLLYRLNPYFCYSVGGYSLFIYGLSRLLVSENRALAQLALSLGIAACITLFLIFKYFDYYRGPLGLAALDLLMPLGLSYYVFQSISYLLVVYRRRAPPLNLPDLLLFLSFFLTITAGPILRAKSFQSRAGRQWGFLDQWATPKQPLDLAAAIHLILAGIFKCWCLAGQLGQELVNPVLNNPQQYDGLTVLAAIYGYSWQLFFNFSGYSQLVLGLGLLLGWRLPVNFLLPLNAENLREFWERWHISLSTWIRDYIYIPLGGGRCGFGRRQLNILIAFVLSGLWHGTGWNFFYWGLLHGLGLVALNLWQRWRRPGPDDWPEVPGPGRRWLSALITFNFVAFTFVIFKSANLAEAALIFSSLANGLQKGWPLAVLGLLALLAGWALYPSLHRLFTASMAAWAQVPPLPWFIPLRFLIGLMVLLAPEGVPEFIYANF